MPPNSLTILTGAEGGGFFATAQEYQRIAKEKGFHLNIRTTNGSIEALALLESGEADAALLQGGVARGHSNQELGTIANVFYEPVWIFYRRASFDQEPLVRLSQAKGKRIALGPDGSATHDLAAMMVADARLTPDNTAFVNLSMEEAAQKLVAGEVDLAFFVLTDTNQLPWRLIREPASN
ncbi:MAG: ABC transporter substrate-binding protein [Anaerolineales bacterium]|nr:ABC transporter substrate-binding protein [Anaerolineales bacterium]